jgi:hypothetical protein
MFWILLSKEMNGEVGNNDCKEQSQEMQAHSFQSSLLKHKQPSHQTSSALIWTSF